MRILSGFYDQPDLAASFFELQEVVFTRFNLAWAHRHGFLDPKVIPFGVFEGKRALSILNATIMDVLVEGKTIKAVQLGTVATHPEFRKRGLGAKLMIEVMAHYGQSMDLMFLFANDTVLSYYPKFGFEPFEEKVFEFALPDRSDANPFRKLNPEDSSDRELLHERFNKRDHLSNTFWIPNHAYLAEWYCRCFYPEWLWYHHESETLLVAKPEGDRISIMDVVSDRVDSRFFEGFAWPGIRRAELRFIPDRFEGDFTGRKDTGEDKLFIRGGVYLRDKDIKVPVLAHT